MDTKPVIFERNGHVYLVGPVAPFTPGNTEIEEFAFSHALLDQAPNPNIMWLRGQYVEADRANENGAVWTSEEIAIKSLTPMFMPVTVMHDPRTAVGLIADVKLLTPDGDGVPRSRIDTTLGVWKHRFPDVAEEIAANYEQGSLMQSQECLPSYYDCGDCGKRYPKLPGGAERANWCAHLRGEEHAKAARILGNVCFTGTGLIFGTRGSRGAFDRAHLEVFQEEVAEAHEKSRHDSTSRHRRKRTVENDVTLTRSEYDQLTAKASKVDELTGKVTQLEETAAKVPDLEKDVERLETEKKAAEETASTEKKRADDLEEKSNAGALAKDRLGKLGAGFTTKLGERTKAKLEEQAGTLEDDAWTERLEELAELTGVKPDEGAGEGGDGSGNGSGGGAGTFSAEELARSGAGAGNGNGGGGGAEPSPEARRSVVAGLVGGSK